MRRHRVRWAWLGLALAAFVLAGFYLSSSNSGICYDYAAEAGGGSTCETVGGPIRLWFVGIAGLSLVTYSLYRAFRHQH